MVLPASHRTPRIPCYSGYLFAYYQLSHTGLSPSMIGLSRTFLLTSSNATLRSYNPIPLRVWFGLLRFRSPLLTESLLISFPVGTKMFQFPTLASFSGWPDITLVGFPHSEIAGSTPCCSSPTLIAAFHALLRLLVPRHPPLALSPLTFLTLVLLPVTYINYLQKNIIKSYYYGCKWFRTTDLSLIRAAL